MSKRDYECIIFAGPTLVDLKSTVDYHTLPIQWLPPARRGDIEKLMADYPAGNLALVDGIFHQTPAVGHAELRAALAAGWRIWGLSSMGAIRAYEMRELGMRGFGRVYHYFLTHDDFRDDEVALLHEPAPSYRACSEPLVHIRVAIAELIDMKLLSGAEADALIAEFASIWFGERTLARLQQLIIAMVGRERAGLIKSQFSTFEKYRIKSHDLRDFLTEQPWRKLD